MYKKIKDKLSKIEEENVGLKIIQNEEEEIRKINLKKESFNKIIQEFVKNKDKTKCFEKMDNITKVSIPYVKDKDYKNLFSEYKNKINEVFLESFINNKTNNASPKKLLDSISTNLFFEYMHFYFSQQIINQGFLKLILDNNSLHKMNNYLFDIVRDVLTENIDIANENAMNANAINYLRASIGDSFMSKPGSNNLNNINNNVMNDLNQKIIKVVSKQNLNLKNSFKMNTLNSLNNFIHENNNNPSFAGSMYNFGNDNYAAYINKLKSQEYEKNCNKIQMIRNVLVSIIKETDCVRNDIKELKENLNITIKNIMNYFAQKILIDDSTELDIKGNNVYENIEDNFKSKFNIESYNNNTELNIPLLKYKNENPNNTKKIFKIIQNKNKINNNNTYEYPSENINPNIFNKSNNYSIDKNIINKTNTSQFINLTSNPSSSNIINNKLCGSKSNINIKNNSIFSKLVKENEKNNIKHTFEKCLEAGTATRKVDNIPPVPKMVNQAKGDLIENANYFTLTQS